MTETGPSRLTAPETAEEFARSLQVSYETVDNLKIYEKLLIHWQKTHNLVSPATLSEIWRRHFTDSAQLIGLAPDAKTWVDLGSGAGFPGLVISICLANQRECVVHLIESNGKKCAFLSEVARQTGAPVQVHNLRIADAARSGALPRADVVTARALAPLSALIELALPFFGAASAGLFLKGREAASEIVDAERRWDFTYRTHPSLSDPSGQIIELRRPIERPADQRVASSDKPK